MLALAPAALAPVALAPAALVLTTLAPTAALSTLCTNSGYAIATRRTVLAAVLSVPPLIGSSCASAADESTCLENIEVHVRAAECQPSGLGIIEVVKGTGLQPQAGETVAVHYNGWLDGFGDSEKLFDSTYDRRSPLTFAVGTGTVTKGFDEAVLSMKVGGKRRIIVPPELGYGENTKDPTSTPGDSTLYFDVELVKVLREDDVTVRAGG